MSSGAQRQLCKVGCSRRQWLLAAAPLAGCVVAPYGSYYRPTSGDPGARPRRAWCSGKAGPVTGLEIDAAPGLRITVRAERDYLERGRSDLPLRIELELPPQSSAQLLAPTLYLREPGSGRVIAHRLGVRVTSRIMLAAGERVDPGLLRPAGNAGRAVDAEAPYGMAHWAVQAAPGFAPAELMLQLPTVLLDGRPQATPALLLARPGSPQRPGDYRSAAEQQRLREREAACRRDTPQLACGNIVGYGERSFELTTGPLRWTGSWSRFESAAHAEPLRGSTTLALLDPRPWRLADTQMLLADAAGTRREALPFARFDLRFDDHVSLDAMLHQQPAGSSLALRLEAALPPDLPAFELSLPALRLGERQIAFAPIIFERRSFDGGIEPFNC